MADSTCEAAYIAASDAVKKVIWLWKFIDEPEVAFSHDGPILLYYDSTGTITQVKESKSHQRTKYFLCCYNLIYKIVDRGDVELQKNDEKKFDRPIY